jgi:hypothetical protein
MDLKYSDGIAAERTLIAVEASAAALQRRLPAGWEVAPYAGDDLRGTSLCGANMARAMVSRASRRSRLWPPGMRRGSGHSGEPRRHQVTEVPPVQAHITEYQFPNVVCGHCGKATRAPLPEPIRGNFGPQMTALIAYPAGRYRSKASRHPAWERGRWLP